MDRYFLDDVFARRSCPQNVFHQRTTGHACFKWLFLYASSCLLGEDGGVGGGGVVRNAARSLSNTVHRELQEVALRLVAVIFS